MADKVAVFLDVENLSGWLKSAGSEVLLEQCTELGHVTVKRAYGDFSLQSVNQRQTDLNLLGFEFVHVYHPAKGKNSADIQIVVDVMEYIARIPDLKWIVLATGDSDFSPLFRRLRELGKSVVGVGPKSVLSKAVKKSCNRFIYTDVSTASNSTTVSIKPTVREDALNLLKNVLSQQSEEIGLSALKSRMLEIDSAFDESKLGFNRFKKFLQSAPEMVTLYQVENSWQAKTTDALFDKCSSSLVESSTAQPKGPTPELYVRLLRKISWRCSSDISLLWDALTKLDRHFPEGFTRREEVEYLIESFGRSRTRGDLQSVICALFKAGCIVYKPYQNKARESALIVVPPESKQLMATSIDAAMLSRLVNVCKANAVAVKRQAIVPLLLNSYTRVELQQLIKQAQTQQQI